MINDPIVAEVRAIRDRHAEKFNYDLDAIYRAVKQKELASGRSYARYLPRPNPATNSEAESTHGLQETPG